MQDRNILHPFGIRVGIFFRNIKRKCNNYFVKLIIIFKFATCAIC